MTEQMCIAAARADMRAQPKADADLLRAVHLYNIAMMLITGRGPAAVHTQQLPATMAAAVDIYHDLLRAPLAPDGEPLEGEIAIWQGLAIPALVRAFDQQHGPRRPRKRRQRMRGAPHMRLDNPHCLAAWFVEQHRRYWCDQNGERRCPAEVLDQIAECVIEHTRTKFGLALSRLELARWLNEPKARRLTQIYYRD